MKCISKFDFREKPRSTRLGYMGHLSYISDEVCKLFEKCSEELSSDVHRISLIILEIIDSEDWAEYTSHSLRETHDRDKQILGGAKPETFGQPVLANLSGVDGDLIPSHSKKSHHSKSPSSAATEVMEDADFDAYNDQVFFILT